MKLMVDNRSLLSIQTLQPESFITSKGPFCRTRKPPKIVPNFEYPPPTGFFPAGQATLLCLFSNCPSVTSGPTTSSQPEMPGGPAGPGGPWGPVGEVAGAHAEPFQARTCPVV